MKHLLSLEKLSGADMAHLLAESARVKRARGDPQFKPLAGQTWALLFSKSSTRTRVSFEVGLRELGGHALFLNSNDIQLGRGEPVKDTARVLGRMIQGAIIRTYAQKDLEEFAEFAGIPTVNALTDAEHPCQVLTDIFTFQEKRGPIQGKVVAFIGDGACNMPASWIWGGNPQFKAQLHGRPWERPDVAAMMMAGKDSTNAEGRGASGRRPGGKILCTENVREAAAGADLLYTDVWVSMGKEAEAAERIKELTGYQINQSLLKLAKSDALVMHCLPAYRGKE